MKHDASKMPAVPPHPKSASSSITETRTPSAKTRVTSSSLRQVKTPATLKTYEMPIQPLVCLLRHIQIKIFITENLLPSLYNHISITMKVIDCNFWSSNMQLRWILIISHTSKKHENNVHVILLLLITVHYAISTQMHECRKLCLQGK